MSKAAIRPPARYFVVEAHPRRRPATTRGVRLFFFEIWRRSAAPSRRTTAASITAHGPCRGLDRADPERAPRSTARGSDSDMALDRSHPDWGRLMFFRCGDLIVEVVHRPWAQAPMPRARLCGASSWRVAGYRRDQARDWLGGRHLMYPRCAPAASRARGCSPCAPHRWILHAGWSWTARTRAALPRHCEEQTGSRASTKRASRRSSSPRILRGASSGALRRHPRLAMTVDSVIAQTRCGYIHVTITERRCLAKAKRILKWQRDPEGMRLRILEAAKQEFATAWPRRRAVDRIAAKRRRQQAHAVLPRRQEGRSLPRGARRRL